MRGWRQLEQSAERTSREMDIRTELRRWDTDFPEIHHELIVRWMAGAVVSIVVTSIYDAFKPRPDRGYHSSSSSSSRRPI